MLNRIILHQNVSSSETEYTEVFVNTTASSLFAFDPHCRPQCLDIDINTDALEISLSGHLQVNFNYLPECTNASTTQDSLMISDNGTMKKISVENLMKKASFVLRSTEPTIGSTEQGDGNCYITENFVYFYTGTMWKRTSISGE